MSNITETISLLDKLRGKCTQGEWQQYPDGDIHMEDRCGIASRDGWEWAQRPKNYVAISWDEKGAMNLNDAEYIVALHNNLPALRQAALDSERYRKAVEALLKALENTSIGPDEFMATIPITEIEEGKIAKIIETYRQAVEQKEVPVSTLKVPYCNKCYPDHDHTRQETVEQKEV